MADCPRAAVAKRAGMVAQRRALLSCAITFFSLICARVKAGSCPDAIPSPNVLHRKSVTLTSTICKRSAPSADTGRHRKRPQPRYFLQRRIGSRYLSVGLLRTNRYDPHKPWTCAGNMNDLQARQSVIDTCLAMNASGINQGTSGNVSLRHDGAMLITPSGMPYASLVPEDIVRMDLDGTVEPVAW